MATIPQKAARKMIDGNGAPNGATPSGLKSSSITGVENGPSSIGIVADTTQDLLLVDPHLPEWLPEIALTNIHVGPATASIRFFRKADGISNYDVQVVNGILHIVRQPSPWSLTATFGERLQDALISLLPGK